MSEDTEARTIFDVGAALAVPSQIGETPFVVTPNGYHVNNLERFLKEPLRKRAQHDFADPDSFVRYVRDFKEEGTRLYASVNDTRVTAILDDHVKGEGSARWQDHVANLVLPLDLDWKAWHDHNDKPMKQIDFAQFIEDRLPTIITPDGAELLEIAQHLEATSRLKFKSAERLSDGARQFVYEEEIDGRVGKGDLTVPAAFLIATPVFRWNNKQTFEAKLRYRIDERRLLFWYHLHRPEDVVDEAFKQVLEAIEVETQLHPLRIT